MSSAGFGTLVLGLLLELAWWVLGCGGDFGFPWLVMVVL